MTTYVVTDPNNGRKLRLHGDSPPTEAELEDIFGSFKGKDDYQATTAKIGLPNTAPALDMASRFVAGAGRALNPMNLVHAVGDVASSQFDALRSGDPMALVPGGPLAKQMAEASAGRVGEAVRLAREGDLLAAAGQAGAAIPMVGEMAAEMGERAADTGDYAGLAGELVGTAIAPKVGAGVLRGGAKVGARVASSPAFKEASLIAKDAAGAKIRLQNPTAGEAVAAAAAGAVGGPQAAATVYGLLKIPKVLKAIAKGRAARKAISETKAQSEVLKMSDDALAKEALIQKMDEGTGLPLNPDGTVTVDFGGTKINLDPARIKPKPEDIKPIPPSQLKPDIPDPVVPEIAPKKVDLGKQAKAEFEARKKSDLWDARTGKPIELTPEQAREAVASQPWNQKKTPATKPEPAHKEAPKANVTLQPELVDRIGKAISPDAAWKDLQKHGAGDGKRIPRQEAREMVDMVWSKKDPSYTSIEQWMADRRDRWESMRTRSKPKQRGAN